MAYLIGLILALGVAALATGVGLDRDRAFYPVVMIVIAFYYVLFAAMGGSTRTLILESVVMSAFVCVALLGFRFDLRLVAIALAAHGAFDAVHSHLIASAAVPPWWPAFCLSYDVVAAAYLAGLSRFRRARTDPEAGRRAA
jgi:hypothetical protein